MMLTLQEMRQIILSNNASVAYGGKVISKSNIHDLPSEAEWALAAGQDLGKVKADLESEKLKLEAQIKLVESAEKAPIKPETKTAETKKAATKVKSIEEELKEVFSSKDVS